MKPTLLILAAGMGSRYGGLKQIDPVGPSGEVIIDYSIHDAIKAGFGKLVFIIREKFADDFKKQVGSKYDSMIETDYAFQELDRELGDYNLPPQREKPWGTGHAILVARDVVKEPFAVINADDYYGANSFKSMAKFLTDKNAGENDYSMVGYTLRNTLSEHGHVSRGVCQCTNDMILKKVVERTQIEKAGNAARFTDEDGSTIDLTGDEIVSMNLWGLRPSVFEHLASQFADFLKASGKELKSELYIPSVIDKLVNDGISTVKVLHTDDSWFGVTYPEDKDYVIAGFKQLISNGVYPENLWGK